MFDFVTDDADAAFIGGIEFEDPTAELAWFEELTAEGQRHGRFTCEGYDCEDDTLRRHDESIVL